MTKRPSPMELLEAELDSVHGQLAVLDARRERLEIAMSVLRELDEPQLPAAQTVPAHAPAQSAEATPASVESEAAGGGAHNPTPPAPIFHPVAKADVEAPRVAVERAEAKADAPDGAELVSREADDADRQQPSTSGLTGDGGGMAAAPPVNNSETAAASLPAGGVRRSSPPAPKANGRPRKPNSLLSRIRAHVAAHPGATSLDCAAALSTTAQRVRDTVKGSGVVLAKAVPGQRRPPPSEPETGKEGSYIRNAIRKLHATDGDVLDSYAAAVRLGLSFSSLRSFSHELGLTWGAAVDKEPERA